MPDAVLAERRRRDEMWTTLLARSDPRAVDPRLLGGIGIRPFQTGHGIFRDKERTSAVAADGVALSLLDTRTVYEDAFDAEGGLYYYPDTTREGLRDSGEIEALKNAWRLKLPVFVVLPGSTVETRDVRRGWITGLDDATRVSLIEFTDQFPEPPPTRIEDSVPFILRSARRSGTTARPRPGQARFRFTVFRRYGPRCAFCPVSVVPLLEAVHLCSPDDGGGDDPRNGLVCCRNHMRAFNANLVGIEPETLRLVARVGGPSLLELGIPADALSRLRDAPHPDALAWRHRAWRERIESLPEAHAV